jgi:hypothetical protein
MSGTLDAAGAPDRPGAVVMKPIMVSRLLEALMIRITMVGHLI